MVKKVVELYQKELHFYNGNYSFYETEKQMRVELQQRAFENQQDYIRQQERFIERFKAKASKAAQAQSVMKRLDKLERIEDVEIERPNIRINFNIDKVPGRVLCELKDITKRFKDIDILEHASAEIDRGDKIALIGANGKGKSTLLRIIAGVEPVEGERKWGHNVEETFYAQHQLEALNVNNTILDEMKEAGSKKTDLELRTLLGCFLFSGDDADKKIKVLSGGEKARVALAKTMISKANFLMLDEPTNHLDIHSNELLIDALNRYEGSLILVSHDRYFISKTANKIWEIVDQKIREFKGTYAEWVDWKERHEKMKAQQGKSEGQKSSSEVRVKKESNPVNTLTPEQISIKSAQRKDLQKLQKQFQKLEDEVKKAQAEAMALEAQLSVPDIYADGDRFRKTEAAYKTAAEQLQDRNKQYELLLEQIMLLEEAIGD
jgi:ATP-binding cassette subfamily F protein 3